MLLSALVLCGAAWVAFRNAAQSRQDERWVAHTYEELDKLDEVLSLLRDAESSERGFILTGQERFLEHYRRATDAISTRQQNLMDLHDNAQDVQQLAQLNTLIARKLSWMSENVQICRSQGRGAVIARIGTGTGIELMNAVRGQVSLIAREQRELLRQRQSMARDSARTTNGMILLGSLTAFCLVGATLLSQGRELHLRHEAESELEAQRGLLRQFVYYAPAAVAMFDRKMQFLLYSRRWLQDYKLGERDLTGQSLYDVFPQMPNAWKDVQRRCLGGAVERNEHDEFVRDNGVAEAIRSETRPWRMPDGGVGGLIMFTEIVTEQKRAEERERRLSEGLRAVLDAADSLLLCPDLETLTRSAVELPRDRLGVERCTLLLFDHENNEVCGTYGIDIQGHTVNEHSKRRGTPQEWLAQFQNPDGSFQKYFDGVDLTLWNGRKDVPIGRKGWIAMLPICNRDEVIATFHYDAAITGAPFDEAQNDLLSVYASLLGNILERKRSEEALRESEERFRLLAENSLDMISRYTPRGTITYASPSSRTLLGYEPEQIVGKLVFNYVHPDDLERVLAFHADAATLPPTYQLAMRAQHSNGTYVWLEITGRTIRDARTGAIIEFQTSSRDISDRKRAEAALLESEERYRELVENSTDLIYRTDENGCFSFFNETAVRLMKFSREEMLGLNYLELVHPDYRDAARRFYGRQFIRKVENSYYEYPALAKDGSLVWFGQNVHLDIEDGRVVGFEAVARDITDRKRAEERQQGLTQGLSAVLNAADELLAQPDLDSLAKRAVELGRENLGLERCAMYLVSPSRRQVRGTYGTDRHGRTVDMRTQRLPITGDWRKYFERGPEGQRMVVIEDTELVEWNGQNHISIGRIGPVGITLIQSPTGPVGSFHNDNGRTGRPLDEVQQELVAVYCSLLGNIIERKRGEEEIRRARDELELRVQQRTAQLAQSNESLQAEVAEREKSQARQTAMAEGLRSVLNIADELLATTNLDSVLRCAVELARERLGLERVGIYLLEGTHFVGTYGTGMNGQTVDERQIHLPLEGFLGEDMRVNGSSDLRWKVYRDEQLMKDGLGELRLGLRDWVVLSPIQSARGSLGLLFNDNAISGMPFNEVQQEIVTLFCSLLGNIIERKRSEEALRQSEERFRVLTQTVPSMIWSLRTDGSIEYANQHTFDFTGCSLSQLRTEGWYALLHPDDLPGVVAQVEESFRRGEAFQIQYRLRRGSDDVYRWQLARALPLRNGDDDINLWLMAGTDIDDQKSAEETLRRSRDELEELVRERTQELVEANKVLQIEIAERRQTEIALRDSEERFKAFMNNSSALAFMKSRDGRLVYMNEPFCRRFGISREDWLGKTEFELFPPEVAEPVRQQDLEVLAGDEIIQGVESVPMPDGQEGHWLVYKFPLRDTSGTKYLAGMALDITQQKRAEAQLRETTMLYQTVLNSANYAIFSTEPGGTIRLFNKAAERQLGYSAEEVIGKMSPLQFHEKEEIEQRAREMSEELGRPVTANREVFLLNSRIGAAEEREWTFVRKDGSRYPVRLSISAVVDPEGNLNGFMGVVSDITEQKQVQEALDRQTQELQRSNAELEQFAYVASHDLQEPLRMVVSYLQLLERRYGANLQGDAHEFIGYAVDGAMRMQMLINDLLDYSRLGTRSKPFTLVDCNKMVFNVLRNLEVALDEAKAEVRVESLPTVQGDASQITRLFQNLIGNAVKFHDKMQPLVEVSVEERPGEWLFCVRDNGIGIAPEHRDRIFAVFQRLHARAEYAGTGIGLAVCKKIVERHGGQIWVESKPGQGSAFYFTIAKTADAEAA
jgi:PAS domain S-box-containing protein